MNVHKQLLMQSLNALPVDSRRTYAVKYLHTPGKLVLRKVSPDFYAVGIIRATNSRSASNLPNSFWQGQDRTVLSYGIGYNLGTVTDMIMTLKGQNNTSSNNRNRKNRRTNNGPPTNTWTSNEPPPSKRRR